MKKVLLKSLVVLCLLLTSCSDDSDLLNDINLQADITELTQLASSGSWKISRFIDSGDDNTHHFDGYRFSFNSDGSLIADSSTANASGTWSITANGNSNNPLGSDDCDDCTATQLEEVLTGCSDWFIDKLERNDQDLEDSLSSFSFNFSEDGSLTVSSNTSTYLGTWESSGNGNTIRVKIAITDISDIDDIWNLHEIELENGESKIDLRIEGGDRLRFKNNCTFDDDNSVSNNGSDIDFNIFFANPQNFNELSEDWDIVSHSDNKIELMHVSGGSGDTDWLTFEK